jgi:hypothetical protein
MVDNSDLMKVVCALAVLLVTLSLGAQTNEIIPVLICADRSYTNAQITQATPAYAVVAYNDGSVQIALSNLPSEYQQKYGYDPAKAAKFLADKKQKEREARATMLARQAAYQQQLAALAGTNQPIRIISVNAFSAYLKCTVQTQNGVRDVNLKNLPDSVRNFISQLNQQRNEVASYEVRVEDYTRAAKKADAVAPTFAAGRPAYVNEAINQRKQANLMQVRAEEMKTQLTKMKANLAAVEAETTNRTTVIACPTGQTHEQLEVWTCVGLP